MKKLYRLASGSRQLGDLGPMEPIEGVDQDPQAAHEGEGCEGGEVEGGAASSLAGAEEAA